MSYDKYIKVGTVGPLPKKKSINNCLKGKEISVNYWWGRSDMPLSHKESVAPCGLDCRLCYRYKQDKNPCPGCRGDDNLKLPSCLKCEIKNCSLIKSGEVAFCSECSKYPCSRVKKLDKRYKKSYNLSVVENLDRIKAVGLDRFISEQEQNWSCSNCGEVLCMHKPECGNCGKVWRK